MRELLQFESLDRLDGLPDGAVHLAIGMFDGVHLGHRRVIESALRAARDSAGVGGVLTFWPHPSRLFRPEDPTRMILTPELKRRELARLGVDFEIQQPFNREFAGVESEDFLKRLLDRIPSLESVHVGENWRFGKGRLGDASLLRRLAEREGIEAVVLECETISGDRVSSTRIRDLLTTGEVGLAAELLGYPYYSIGTVAQGAQRGRTIGAPTLNLPFEGDLEPAYGVYCVHVSDVFVDRIYPGVANFGVKPTVAQEARPLLEAHVLEDCPFDYGQRLKVDWLKFLRPERRFDSLERLRSQIAEDLTEGRRYFGLGSR